MLSEDPACGRCGHRRSEHDVQNVRVEAGRVIHETLCTHEDPWTGHCECNDFTPALEETHAR